LRWIGPADESGNVYVEDYYVISGTYYSRVQKFNSTGTYLFTIGGVSGGCGNYQFYYATDLATDASGNLYVADDYCSRVQKFNSSGVYQSTIGVEGSAYGGSGLYWDIWGPAVDSSGNVYVYDANDGVIVKFNSNGTFLMKFSSKGSGNGQIGSYPYRITTQKP
jgi:hypothetical protein